MKIGIGRAARAGLAALCVAATAAACDGANAFTAPGGTGVPDDGTFGGSVQGTVTADGVGVGGIVVVVVAQDSAVTDGLGRYVVANLPPRTYNVAVRVPLQYDLAAGEEALRSITVSDDGPTVVDWRLTEVEPDTP